MTFAKLPLMRAREYLLQDAANAGPTRLVRVILLAIVIVVGVWTVYFAVRAITFPYPLEYREGASLVMTKFLLEGRNPFSLENQPLGMNNYGIIYNLAALPLAAVFGNTLVVHRVLTVVFILLGALLVFRTARAGRGDPGLAILAAEFVAIALVARAGLGAFPSSMGAFFFLAALLIPFARGFDRWGLVLSAFFCLLAFYTKPYFVLAFGIVASYVFLFESKARALAYVLLSSALFVASFFLVKNLFPLYFFDTVISNRLQAVQLDPAHLYNQLRELLLVFYPALLAASALALLALTGARSRAASPAGHLLLHPNFLDLRLPLLSARMDYFAYATICSALAFVFVLGPNPGSFLTSAFQVVLPPFFLWLAAELNSRTRLTWILVPLLLFNLVLFCQTWLNPASLRKLSQSTDAWVRLYAVADGSNRMLNSPMLAAEMIGRGMWPIDSGQTEYYFGLLDYPKSSLVGPDQAAISSQGQAYLDAIRDAVRNREFDRLIISDEPRPLLFKYGVLRQFYHPAETFTIWLPLVPDRWDIVVWEPGAQ
jgi:hypothetical protein